MVGQDHIPALLTGSGQLHQDSLERGDELQIHRGWRDAGQQLREPLQPARLESGVGQAREKRDAASQGLHSQEPELTDVIPGTNIARRHGHSQAIAAGVCLGSVGLGEEANGSSKKLLGRLCSLKGWKKKEINVTMQNLLTQRRALWSRTISSCPRNLFIPVYQPAEFFTYS